MRPESLFIRVLQSDPANPGVFESISVHDVTEILASSQSFTFKGHRYDLGNLVPSGITLYETISNTLFRASRTRTPGSDHFHTGCLWPGMAFP